MTLREQVFRKMGCEWHVPSQLWLHPKWKNINPLRAIDSSWEVTAKYLVPFMRGEKYEYEITPQRYTEELGSLGQQTKYFRWYKEGETKGKSEIIEDKLAEAACKAFMEAGL